LIELIYHSQASCGFDEKMIDALLRQARDNNSKSDITGMLFFDGEFFVQILEGDEVAIDTLYTIIGADARHDNVQKIYQGSIKERSFQDWSMGYEFVSPMTGQYLEFDWKSCEERLDSQGKSLSRGLQFFKYLKESVIKKDSR